MTKFWGNNLFAELNTKKIKKYGWMMFIYTNFKNIKLILTRNEPSPDTLTCVPKSNKASVVKNWNLKTMLIIMNKIWEYEK